MGARTCALHQRDQHGVLAYRCMPSRAALSIGGKFRRWVAKGKHFRCWVAKRKQFHCWVAKGKHQAAQARRRAEDQACRQACLTALWRAWRMAPALRAHTRVSHHGRHVADVALPV
eukprot:365944-Chlamydomonas_euryale.AAC.2